MKDNINASYVISFQYGVETEGFLISIKNDEFYSQPICFNEYQANCKFISRIHYLRILNKTFEIKYNGPLRINPDIDLNEIDFIEPNNYFTKHSFKTSFCLSSLRNNYTIHLELKYLKPFKIIKNQKHV